MDPKTDKLMAREVRVSRDGDALGHLAERHDHAVRSASI
jgi:hypothetical protein